MYTNCSKYDTSVLRIRIDLSRSGKRAFNRLNAKLGQAYIRFFQLERDLAEYIERHIDAGISLDAEFDVRYVDGIVLTIFYCSGIYYVTDVTDIVVVIAAKAILVWQRFKCGGSYLVHQVLVGWYNVTVPAEATVCC